MRQVEWTNQSEMTYSQLLKCGIHGLNQRNVLIVRMQMNFFLGPVRWMDNIELFILMFEEARERF